MARRARGGVDNTAASAYEGSVSSDVTEVVVRRDDRVVTLTLDRPADQNRLTRSMLLSLQRIVDDLAGDGDVQAVVLTGGGTESFSMGILSPAVRAGYTKEQVLELVTEARALSDALRHAFEWSHDVGEGAAAHREGRRPRFTGR